MYCVNCGNEYSTGEEICSNCGTTLPDQYVSERLSGNEQKEYSLQCPECNMPYRLDDYREDIENIFCSRCKTELSRA